MGGDEDAGAPALSGMPPAFDTGWPAPLFALLSPGAGPAQGDALWLAAAALNAAIRGLKAWCGVAPPRLRAGGPAGRRGGAGQGGSQRRVMVQITPLPATV